ncbi:MAG TPA: hypothetical protein VJ890_19680 [Vineibacter sp.]|nr:hypothetical protein [Vineibacter sp.]
MAFALKVFDNNVGRRQEFRRELALVSTRVTASELIRRRVEAELDELAAAEKCALDELRARMVSWLVTPSLHERALNGDRGDYGPAVRDHGESAAKKGGVDREAVVSTALSGFTTNRFVMLLDGRQVTELDSVLTITPNSQLNFIKLVPLVGG